MRIRELHVPDDTGLIEGYLPVGMLDLLSREDVLTLGAFAEEEEEQLTSFEDDKEEDTGAEDTETESPEDAEDSEDGEDSEDTESETDGDDEESVPVKHRRKVENGEFVGFAVVFMHPVGAEVLWLYTLPDCRTLGGASELLNEIVEYSFRNSLDRISLLVPDKVSFPAMGEDEDDTARTESFLNDCNFESCRKYAYDKISPTDESAAAILNSLPSKRGRRYSQRLLLGFLND